ncbi:chalcone-flavanone isomerase-domain-containing protein, partial [Astrocystis sublimbata]
MELMSTSSHDDAFPQINIPQLLFWYSSTPRSFIELHIPTFFRPQSNATCAIAYASVKDLQYITLRCLLAREPPTMIPARSLSSTSAPLLRSLTTAPRLSTAPARIRCLQNPRSPAQCRTFLRNSRVAGRSLDGLNVHRMRNESYDWYQRRRNFMLCGGIASALATVYTAYLLYLEVTKPKKMDSGLPPEKADPFTTDGGIKRMTVLHDADGREIVPTGNSVVPSFPRLLDLAIGAETGPQKERLNGVEYTLVGLGVRTVTFIGIQVYMVGYYIATQDIAALQARLVKEVNPIATTLIASEKDTLRETLLDPVRGEQLWDTILREVRPRSVFRIVPVRDTDFHHLRDGFVRAITARSQANNAEFGDETFGAAM